MYINAAANSMQFLRLISFFLEVVSAYPFEWNNLLMSFSEVVTFFMKQTFNKTKTSAEV